MADNTPLDLSVIPEKLYFKKGSCGATYVQIKHGVKFDEKKQRDVPVRLTMGKVVAGNESTFIPNRNFFELFGDRQ
ncbi:MULTISPECIES: hypothetical protein [unclassified Anaerobiospirillum]|uniref:hypothetical protein n=1 Tax=unclassified Anaerobiospirillum TaxID=2647410 RepID=UPI001FF614B4|nr:MULTISPECIES: hypothetical protein [unclassified Anaerobiospirillum]MCK0526735.1 hypothetical protein [Anaerobiospirillum sp. NML120449]MCK0535010.1 hypothetical protein [Anaerobiospirillum sp. NML120511]MCK0540232.1 hypothetical protein [Anaerobiospirillum sp. NML02-A-032]